MRLLGRAFLAVFVVMGPIMTFLCRGWSHHDVQLAWVRGQARTGRFRLGADGRVGHFGAVEPRTARRQGTVCTPYVGSPLRADSRCSAATRPTSSRHMSTLVSGGSAPSAMGFQLS